MSKQESFKKAVAMVLVLFIIFSVIVVANILLIFFSSQFQLSHHQVSRIQAYYAGMAGINYALEQLRTGNWNSVGIYNLSDNEFPWIIRKIEINITNVNVGPFTGLKQIRTRVNYITRPD
ncbi:MAG: hypothetical protein NC909_01665 [Candidatus Omnitrophica bacterium]|nr:hypothetical protein [Candidatus Omnitrophota bacterium]